MATTSIPRLSDTTVIEVFVGLAAKHSLPNARIVANGDGSFISIAGDPASVMANEQLSPVLALNATMLTNIQLQAGPQNFALLAVGRPDSQVFDHLSTNWPTQQPFLEPKAFAALAAEAKSKLRALSLDSRASTLGIASFDELVKARLSEIRELQQVVIEITERSQGRAIELENEHAKRRSALEVEFAELKHKAQEEIIELKAVAEAAAKSREEALDAREQEVDKSEAKYARRQLRVDLLKMLASHSTRFELSPTTRRLRMPMYVLLAAALVGTGYLTYLSFVDLAATIGDANAAWWRVTMVSAKQVVFATIFLGLAAYMLRWLESWSRRHADAEFYFKQLELDINRASWVVEIAAEWREKEGAELPKELLVQLANHLFSEPGFAAEPHGGDGLLATILGGATKLKLATPGGGELEIGRRGIRNLVKR